MGVFRDLLEKAGPLRLREPLAAALGAFSADDAIIEYGITDAVKLAGHICPTVTGAYLCCARALEQLYGPGEVPERGSIAVTVYGEPDEGVYGVMAQVVGFITGAAPETGFKGLGGRFARKDLLRFSGEKPDEQAACFRFQREDTGAAVMERFRPWLIPFPAEKSQRMAVLMEAVVGGYAGKDELADFQELWMEKISGMLAREDIDSWLEVEPV